MLAPPVGRNAREPWLAALGDGRIVMSWTEETGAEAAIRVAFLDDGSWSAARTIHRSKTKFVNWADSSSVVALSDGTLAAHWLELNGTGDYQYDVNIAFSSDEGESWTRPVILHDDRSLREHGFVSLVPDGEGGLTALWLDGRDYDNTSDDGRFGNAMQVRARHVSPDGTMGPESVLDARACTCCQTSATRTGAGDVIAVYRDRTAQEIRDISVVRLTDGNWTPPKTVHADGWEIAGCPVNGPAIDSLGADVAVIWFTGANGEAKVRIAFSSNGGVRFDDAVPLDLGAPGGRVDVLQMPDGTALALWMEFAAGGEAIVICRAKRTVGCTDTQTLHLNRGQGSVGFPKMVRGTGGAYVAWTASVEGTRGRTTVRVVKLDLRAP